MLSRTVCLRVALFLLLLGFVSILAMVSALAGPLEVFAGQDKANAMVDVPVVFNDARLVSPDPMDPNRTYTFSWDFDIRLDLNLDSFYDNDNESYGLHADHTYRAPGTYTVTLTVMVDTGEEAKDTLEVTVRADRPPAIMAVTLPDAVQDEEYAFTFTATDPDDSPANLSWSDDSPMFAINGSGGIRFTPLNADVYTHFFNITVRDPCGLTGTREFTLFIQNVNDPPTFREVPPQTAYDGQVFTLDLSAYVEDPDLLLPPGPADALAYRDDSPILDVGLTTGLVIWDRPSDRDVGKLYFVVTVTDRAGARASRVIDVTVVNTNDPPRLDAIPRQVLHQGVSYGLGVPFSDPDLDVPSAGEALAFSNDRHELFAIDPATGRIQFTPVNGQVGVWDVNITVTDAAGASATRMVVFEVVNENDPPTLEPIGTQQLTEGAPFTLQVLAADPDLSQRLVDGLPVDPNERLEYRTNSTRVPIDGDTGLISFTPTDDDAKAGGILVRITVVDRASLAATMDVLFNVADVDNPPTDVRIVGLAEGEVVRTDAVYAVSGFATDDDDAQENLTYDWYINGTHISGMRSFKWRPSGEGPCTVSLEVTDPDGRKGTAAVTVAIARVPPTPVVVSPEPGATIDKERDLEITLVVPLGELDPGRDYTVNVSSNVSGLLASRGLDEGLELRLGHLPTGDHLITVAISDGEYEASTRFNITVVEPSKRVASLGPGAAVVIGAVLVAVVVWSLRRWKGQGQGA